MNRQDLRSAKNEPQCNSRADFRLDFYIAQAMRFPTRLAAFTVCGLIALGALSQTQPAATATPQVDSGKIIQFLSQTVSWYHQRAVEQKLANEASDLTYAQENRRIADQVVPLA